MVFSHSRKRHIKTQPHSRKEVGGLSFFSGSLLGTQTPSTFRLKERCLQALRDTNTKAKRILHYTKAQKLRSRWGIPYKQDQAGHVTGTIRTYQVILPCVPKTPTMLEA